uniref:ANK2 n=1 Tax=Poeciliopsis prolifica TaxID=188132 RepID=A0A0S7ERU0_9TELE
MDIVHLIETKIDKSAEEETNSHTYAEIEQTLMMDHSEGFGNIHEDIDSPRSDRCKEAAGRSPVLVQEVPVVSAEELSTSLSSLHETSGRVEADPMAPEFMKKAQREKLQRELETTNSSQSIYEEVTDMAHIGSFKQADILPDIPPQTVTEEKYTDEHGNMVVKKITRKVIRKCMSPDGSETQEVSIEGSHQEMVKIEEGDAVSRVAKRTVLHSRGDQKELTFSEPLALGATTASEFEVEPVQGRKVSKVVKTTVVRGERMEKQRGDPLLSADLPQPRRTLRRSQMYKSCTQKRTVVRDAQGKHVHLERLEDTPDALQPDALQQHLRHLLQRYCEDDQEEEEDKEEEEEEKSHD